MAEQLIERAIPAQDQHDLLLPVRHRLRPERYLPSEVYNVTPAEVDGNEVLVRVDQGRSVENRAVIDGSEPSWRQGLHGLPAALPLASRPP